MGIETMIALGIGSAVAGIGGMITQSGAADLARQGGQAGADAALFKGKAIQATDEYNAQADEQVAASNIAVAGAASQDFQRKGSDTVETAVADQGGSGVTSEGSPLMVDENTVRQVALGASRIAYGGQLSANRALDDAKLQRLSGSNAVQASYLDAKTSLLTGATAATNADAAMWNSGANLLGNAAKFANPNFGKGIG